jgi:hypothetical protein
MASEKDLKAELLALRMAHPEVQRAFIDARDALWETESRMDRIKVEIAWLHKGPGESKGKE